MRYELFISARYLRVRQGKTFVSLITLLSVAGVAVGVMALMVVIAVMAGFQADFTNRLLDAEAHVTVTRTDGLFVDWRAVRAQLAQRQGVVSALPMASAQVMLRSSGSIAGATLGGVEPARAGSGTRRLIPDATLLPDPLQRPADEPPAVVLGRDLARNLGVSRGDTLYLISLRGMLSPVGHLPAMQRLRVSGLFSAGLQEIDAARAYLHLADAQRLLRLGDGVGGIELKLSQPVTARAEAERIAASLGAEYRVHDWMAGNQNLFAALKLERSVMFIILALIVLVAAFNIASTLVMMVMEKTRDIAILMAMGVTPGGVRRIFVLKGILIGLAGTLLGVILGAGLCEALQRYKLIELPGDVYYITSLPVQLQAWDVLLIAVAAVAICYMATLYPARQAARLDPIEAIRYG